MLMQGLTHFHQGLNSVPSQHLATPKRSCPVACQVSHSPGDSDPLQSAMPPPPKLLQLTPPSSAEAHLALLVDTKKKEKKAISKEVCQPPGLH